MPSRTAIVIGTDTQINAMCCAILEPRSWTIYSAADNADALRLVQKNRCDLIVTYEKTSGREDVELLCAIRRIHPRTRVIILTDRTTPADVIAAIRGHAFCYFTKPFSLDSLTAMLQYAILEPFWDDGIEVVSARPGWICLLVRCDIHTADRLMHFFDEIVDLPTAEKEVVATAFRELLTNAIEHGGKLNPEQRVEISYLRTNRAVACKITDPGPGFSPDNIPHAATMNPPDNPLRHLAFRNAKNLRPGGYGILLAKNSIDELRYNEQGNQVILIKYVDPAGIGVTSSVSGISSDLRESTAIAPPLQTDEHPVGVRPG